MLFLCGTGLLCILVCSTKGEKLVIADDDVSGGMLLKSNYEAPGEEVVRTHFKPLSYCQGMGVCKCSVKHNWCD